MKPVHLLALIALVPALLVAGCTQKRKDPNRATVRGKITLDGKDLATGKIAFDPMDGTPPQVLSITDGKYEGKATTGKNRVRISATQMVVPKEKGFSGPGSDKPSEENLLPARYNSKSEIDREVEAGGENTFNFDLKSS
jgi:hypothetical protein